MTGQQQPKYAAMVPESIQTPDVVESSRLGHLEFFDGMPSDETVRKVYDQLDFSRAVETFLTGCPAASNRRLPPGHEGGRDGHLQHGHPRAAVRRADSLADPQHHDRLLRAPDQRRGRADGHRGPARCPRAGRRRLLPLGHRRRLHRSRPRPTWQVPVPPAGARRRGPARLSRRPDAHLPPLAADACLRGRWGPREDCGPRQEALAPVPVGGSGEPARAALRGPERVAVQHNPRQ